MSSHIKKIPNKADRSQALKNTGHVVVKAPSVFQSNDKSKKTTRCTGDTNITGETTNQLPKKVPQMKSSHSRFNPRNFAKSNMDKMAPYDEKPVGGAKNVSAVFGSKLEETSSLPPVMIKQARQSGQLNLSNRNLSQIPDKVWKINEPDEEEEKRLKKGLSIDRVSCKHIYCIMHSQIIFKLKSRNLFRK